MRIKLNSSTENKEEKQILADFSFTLRVQTLIGNSHIFLLLFNSYPGQTLASAAATQPSIPPPPLAPVGWLMEN